MTKFLKKQPLVGLALAIAAGYVLAHIIIKIGDSLYESGDLYTVVSLAIAAALLSMVLWKRRNILGWIRRHRIAVFRFFFSAFVSGLIAGVSGGKAYTTMFASGRSDDLATLGAIRVFAFCFALSSLLFGCFFLALKLLKSRRENRQQIQAVRTVP